MVKNLDAFDFVVEGPHQNGGGGMGRDWRSTFRGLLGVRMMIGPPRTRRRRTAELEVKMVMGGGECPHEY